MTREQWREREAQAHRMKIAVRSHSLTPEQLRRARQMKEDGFSHTVIARRFGISKDAVNQALRARESEAA